MMKLQLEQIKDVSIGDQRVTLVRAPGYGGSLWTDRLTAKRIQQRRAKEFKALKAGVRNLRGTRRNLK